MKITFNLRGGLGNQLFQATAANYFAIKYSSNAILDDVAIIRHKNPTRRTWLREIDLNKFYPEHKVQMTNLFFTNLRSRKFIKKIKKYPLNQYQLEKLTSFERNIEVYDWFHTSKFLPKDGLDLKKEYLGNLSRNTLLFGDAVKVKDNTAAIHIRLGDFKKAAWGVLPSDWYRKALDYLTEIGISHVDCYSDDISEAKEIIRPLVGNLEFQFPELLSAFKPHELLWILTQYKTYISSNSSLSWWASYLNQNKNPRIFGPWSGDLYVAGWQIIS